MENPRSQSANSDQHSPSSPTATTRLLVPGDSTEDPFESPDPSKLELPVGLPLSHKVFRDPEFDPDQFLLSHRHTALDDLRTKLRNYLSALKSELVGLINEDYEDFIGLGMGLRGTVERAIGRMKTPIGQAKQDILEARAELEVEREDLEGLLNKRRKVIEAKKLVRLMLDCGDTVTKVEEMLSIHPPHLTSISNPKPNQTHYRSNLKFGSSSKTPKLSLDLADDINDIEAGVKRLERFTNEYSRMLYLVSKARDLSYVSGLQPRINQITEALHRELGSLLKSILRLPRSNHHKKEFLFESLRAYESLGMVTIAEELIKTEIVLPRMSNLIHRDALNTGALSPLLPASPEVSRFRPTHSPRDLAGNTLLNNLTSNSLPPPEELALTPLPLLYNKILAFIAREMSSIVEIADRLLGGAKQSNEVPDQDDCSSSKELNSSPSTRPVAYNILVNSVILPILQLITNSLGSSLFAAGNPSTFHKNFSYTTKFLDQLEGLCISPRQVLNLRAHPDWNAFKNKWQLAVYAQIRTKEMILAIEEGLRDGTKPPPADPSILINAASSSSSPNKVQLAKTEALDYSMKGTLTLDLALHSIWQDDVFLTELTHRFWRLTLMAISRYATWLNSVARYYSLNCSESTLTTGGVNENKTNRIAADSNQLGISSSANRSNSSFHDSKNNPSEAPNDDEILRICTFLLVDIIQLDRRIEDLFHQSIEPRIPKVSIGPDYQTPEDVLKISTEKIMRLVGPLSSEIKTTLVKKCSEKLRFIRSVGSSARASKTIPTEPSYFISDILNDIRVYLEKYGKKITDQMRIELVTSMIDELSGKYLAILINVQRSEDSLRKLKKGKHGFSIFNNHTNSSAGSGSEGVLDEDYKVKVQLKLDVDRLELDAINLGADLSTCKSFIDLKQNVSK